MFDRDVPIESCDEDEVNRCQFAKNIAKAICQYRDSSALVVGILGSWGSGKTSIINMVCEVLEQHKDEKLIIIKFNPWLFSGQKDLLNKFFEELQSNLPDKALRNKLSKYYRRILPDKISLLKLIGIEYNLKNLKSIPLENIKEDIDEYLLESELKVLIVIDDIDRLTAEEIREIFQLIRIVDLPNIIYLVSFDRNPIINALEEVQGGNGEEYLEKIIQVPFEVPSFSYMQLQKIIQKEVGKVLNKKFSGFDLNAMFPYFKTIRDIKRYINLLKFKVGAIGSETNEMDLAYITLLELFEPKLFGQIRKNQDAFTKDFSAPRFYEDQKKRVEEIYEKASDHAKPVLNILFPGLNNTDLTDTRREFVKERRLCSPKYFDRYFEFSLNPSVLSTEEISRLLESTKEKESLKGIILENPSTNLEYLDIYIEDVPAENIENVINALADLPSLSSINYVVCKCRLIFNSLKLLDDEYKRLEVLKNAIDKGEDIYLASNILDPTDPFPRHQFEKLLGEKGLGDVESVFIQKLHKLFDEKMDEIFKMEELYDLPVLFMIWNEIEPHGPEEYIKKIDKRKREDLLKRIELINPTNKKTKESLEKLKQLLRDHH